MKTVLEIWIVHQRIGTYIVPDIWNVVVPEPVSFCGLPMLRKAPWSTDLHPVRSHED
jgi:hypothetical protein